MYKKMEEKVIHEIENMDDEKFNALFLVVSDEMFIRFHKKVVEK